MEYKLKKRLTKEIVDWLKSKVDEDETLKNRVSSESITVSKIFFHSDSLRLRPLGYELLKKFFDYQEFDYNSQSFKTKDLLSLSKNLNSPFFIKRSKIAIFSHEQIVIIKMIGSFDKWIKTLE